MMNLKTLKIILDPANIPFLLYTMTEEKHMKFILTNTKQDNLGKTEFDT